MRTYYTQDSNIFNQNRLSYYFDCVNDKITTHIKDEDDSYILNVGESGYVDYLYNTYCIKLPIIKFDDKYVDNYEANIPKEYFSRAAIWGFDGTHIRRNVIKLTIPVCGDPHILQYSPSKFSLCGSDAILEWNTIYAEYIDMDNKPQTIKNSIDRTVQHIEAMFKTTTNDVEAYNKSLPSFIKGLFDKRKKEILSQNSFMAALDIPIRKRDDAPSTFAIPEPKLRKPIVMKPVVTESGFKSEPTLPMDCYNQILKLINDAGKNFETHPSLYKEKGEEDLRDHILFLLDPNFTNGSATGETFNKRGKTDILLKFDSEVAFIAECKFWSGKVNYLKTIDQLLKYLTWRNTKTSVVIFVDKKEISNVLNTIKEETPKHSNFVKYVCDIDINWFNYIFHINGDKNREVYLAVQVFHLPPVD